jgi:hypothetical protein
MFNFLKFISVRRKFKMHLTLVCLLFIVVSTVSARTEYKKISWGAPKVFRYANYAAGYGGWKPWSTF